MATIFPLAKSFPAISAVFPQAAYRSFVPTETIAKNQELSKIVIGGLAILGIGVVIYQWRKYSDKLANETKKV